MKWWTSSDLTPRLPKLAAFLEKRWPQLESRIRTREENYRRRFLPKEPK